MNARLGSLLDLSLIVGMLLGALVGVLYYGPPAEAQTNIVTLYGCTPATVTARPCTLQAVSVTTAGVIQAVGQ